MEKKDKRLLKYLGKIGNNIMKTIQAFLNADAVESEDSLQAAIALANNNGAEITSEEGADIQRTTESLEKLSKIYESEWGLKSNGLKDKKPTDVNPIHSIGGRSGSSVKETPYKRTDKEREL